MNELLLENRANLLLNILKRYIISNSKLTDAKKQVPTLVVSYDNKTNYLVVLRENLYVLSKVERKFVVKKISEKIDNEIGHLGAGLNNTIKHLRLMQAKETITDIYEKLNKEEKSGKEKMPQESDGTETFQPVK